MLKKLKVILGIAAVATLGAGLAACTTQNKLDEYRNQGYVVSVTYDSNGGKFYNRDGVSIVDMYNPENFEADADGVIHIKLSDPTESNRPSGNGDGLSLVCSQYFFAGWYQTREIYLNESGNPVDFDGRELIESDGAYYVADTMDDQTPVESSPRYSYSDYWDFSQDTIDYKEGDGEVSVTLYAGWVPYYRFDYYAERDGEWELYDTTSFDYKEANRSDSSDLDTIWTPDWLDGKMNHSHLYSNMDTYIFPEIEGMTFSAAYTDEACTQKIEGAFVHTGSLDVEHALAINPVQNIYVVADEGTRYRIETADQLIANANIKGIYEILADLDFTDKNWPAAFATGTFGGVFASAEGENYTVLNAKATIGNSAEYAGLFGRVAAGAVIRDVTFENATVDFASSPRLHFSYGLFSGEIDENATVSGVTVGGLIKIGNISVPTDYTLHLIAVGNRNGITGTGVSLTVYGLNNIAYYEFSVNPDEVDVDANGYVTLVATLNREERQRQQESYDIITSWRQNND